MNSNNKKKFKQFLEIAKELNRHKIIPILYGSLGVSQLVEVRDVDDIDILISDKWLTNDNNNIEKLKNIMYKIDYKQDPVFPHEFFKGKNFVGFSPINDTERELKLKINKTKITKINGIKFRELSAEKHLEFYKNSIHFAENNISIIQKKIKKKQDKIKKLKELIKK